MAVRSLWAEADPAVWLGALARYDAVIEAQGSAALVEHDGWYRHALPAILADRDPAYLTLDELARVVKWKMTRGEWRPRNLGLAQSADPNEVEAATREAFRLAPDPRRPLTRLSKLPGIGPATASAVLAAYAPDVYPFFDDFAPLQVPGLGELKYTAGYYAAYAERLRQRAAELRAAATPETSPPGGWTAHACAQALWAWAGGKAGQR